MKVLYGLIYEMDITMQFMYIFLPSAIALLFILHHFMKEHRKIWAGLTLTPLVVYLIYMSQVYYKGDKELTIERYTIFGVISLFIALWGLAVLLKRSFVAYGVIISVFSTVFLLIEIVLIWAVLLRPNVGNYSKLGWTDSFSCAIDYMEQEYVLNDWKQIDYDMLREKYIPRMQEIEKSGDENAYIQLLYEFTNEFHDGHVGVRGDFSTRHNAVSQLAGNDYGLSMFRCSTGEVIAVLVDPESACTEYGIHDGTVITKWNGIPVDEAAEKVLCLDASYEFKTWENIHIAEPIFLAGQGGDEVEVTFINDKGDEKTVTLTADGSYLNRRTAALDIIFDTNVIEGGNYSNRIINGNIGYIRISDEEYSTDPWFNTKCTLSSFSKEIHDDLYRRIEAMKKEGVDSIILDIRNNNGGYGFESRTVASLFVDGDIPCELKYDKDGKVIVASTAKPIEDQGPFSDMKVVVLVNGETCSAGELMTNYLTNGKNVIIMGSTSTWGAAQSTGGSVVLTDSKYSIRFPIIPESDKNGLPNVDVGADYHTRIQMDYMIDYDRDEAVKLFENPETDYVLEEAILYLLQ